ncbi:hypothetical protein GGP68_001271 [Salinibacter ruber]|uniref:Uncharacterized protein n=1 Tax=Salinibacter ruber TaxID=146919 RepID=A0A9X2Q4F4_9BACT|nr:hypothetical protein [Salinibacter ruber]MCS3709905.1 hypothetical protein [Salinibacter ruber]
MYLPHGFSPRARHFRSAINMPASRSHKRRAYFEVSVLSGSSGGAVSVHTFSIASQYNPARTPCTYRFLWNHCGLR